MCIKSWMDCGIVSIGQLFGLTYNAFRTRFPNAKADFLLYEGVLSDIRGYQRKLSLDVEENFVVGDSRVWKCIGKGNVKTFMLVLLQMVTHQNESLDGVKLWML